jgi:hypothetical protein
VAQLYEGDKANWIFDSSRMDLSDWELYSTSFYFTVTTILTIGYGDIHAINVTEKWVSVAMMIIGVISFSFATGALSSIIQKHDHQEAKLKEKLSVLD